MLTTAPDAFHTTTVQDHSAVPTRARGFRSLVSSLGSHCFAGRNVARTAWRREVSACQGAGPLASRPAKCDPGRVALGAAAAVIGSIAHASSQIRES